MQREQQPQHSGTTGIGLSFNTENINTGQEGAKKVLVGAKYFDETSDYTGCPTIIYVFLCWGGG